ncbi:histidine kinase [Kibdelosporangium philippinense]|uniref:histidine kinase n=1 Tax=Kibdelosporangium philippinense TaxID=211113 RepID=A0ABS8ZEV3_9PSEU|nr:histidine kinase [Kibdelosporangium philippinense]MCE7005440.1 histidine kinase [Kibdelosporangium philippinense]
MWTERRQDIALAVFLAAVLATLYWDRWLAMAVTIVGSLLLVWRRRFPVAIFMVTAVAFIASLLWHWDSGGPLVVITWIPLYGLAAYSIKVEPTKTVLGLIGVTVAVIVLMSFLVTAETKQPYAITALLAFGWVGTAWLLGRYHRTKRAYLTELEERTAQLEREREAVAAQAAAEERARIARELHDMLAHTMSGMVVLAGGGRKIAETNPEAAATALAKIEDVSRKGMAENRMLLDSIQEGSVRTIDHLSTLVDEARQTGLDVQVDIDGQPIRMPLTAGAAAFRIVQESLTNVMRHSGVKAARISVKYWPDAFELQITDDGEGGVVNPGHGVTGMRERAELAGGALRAGPRPEGGWSVRAIFPVPS